MRIFQLTRKDRELFLDMDPLLMMERLEFPGTFALAAVLENEETGEDIPAGLAICMDTGKSIVIEWMCVSMNHRKKGIGERLLVSVFDIAAQLGYQTVAAYLNKDYGREFICAGEENYLEERLFTETKPLAGEWVTDIYSLSQNPMITGKSGSDKSDKIEIRPLAVLPPVERRRILELLMSKKYASSLYSIREHLDYLDSDLSMLIYEKGELTGGLLVQNARRVNAIIQGEEVKYLTQNVFYPVYMCIESSQGVSALITAVLQATTKKYAADGEVHVVMRKGHYAPLMERLSPDTKIENKLMIASVAEYLKQGEEAEISKLLTLE